MFINSNQLDILKLFGREGIHLYNRPLKVGRWVPGWSWDQMKWFLTIEVMGTRNGSPTRPLTSFPTFSGKGLHEMQNLPTLNRYLSAWSCIPMDNHGFSVICDFTWLENLCFHKAYVVVAIRSYRVATLEMLAASKALCWTVSLEWSFCLKRKWLN